MDKTILTCKWFKRGGEKSVWGELGCGVLSLREMMVRYKKTENFSAKLLRVANYVPYSMLFWTNVQNLGLGCWLVSIVGHGQ